MLKKAKLIPSTDVEKIADAFREGKVICLPTDTVYAISCDATNDKTIHRIYDIKKRALSKPLPIFVSDIDMAIEYAELHPKALLFAIKFWPGPLTIILQKVANVSLPSVLVKNGKIGIRMPNKRLVQDICANIKRPIIATSANISSNPNINSARDIEKEFFDKVDVIVENNNHDQDLAVSTVIEFTSNDSYQIMREGRILKLELVLMEKL